MIFHNEHWGLNKKPPESAQVRDDAARNSIDSSLFIASWQAVTLIVFSLKALSQFPLYQQILVAQSEPIGHQFKDLRRRRRNALAITNNVAPVSARIASQRLV